jgi:hypothetical protein
MSAIYTCDGVVSKRIGNQLYVACWEPDARAGAGRGIWVWIPKQCPEDTAEWLRERFGDDEYERHFDAGGPESVHVDSDGIVRIYLEDDSVRELRERAGEASALAFTWSYESSSPARSRKRSTLASLMSS